jgi:hypothetical protein
MTENEILHKILVHSSKAIFSTKALSTFTCKKIFQSPLINF